MYSQACITRSSTATLPYNNHYKYKATLAFGHYMFGHHTLLLYCYPTWMSRRFSLVVLMSAEAGAIVGTSTCSYGPEMTK
jgi:hypothetical protein